MKSTSVPEGYDPETFEYVGPCPNCRTDHGGWAGPETLGGQLACVEALSQRAGGQIALEVRALRRRVDSATKALIRRYLS